MANLNITNIPAPRVPFIDERTGLMAREWYRFFLNLFVLTGSGNNPISLEELQLGPTNQPDLTELLIQINQNIAPQYEDQSGDFLATLDTAQLMSMMSRFENAEAAIQGAYLQPVVQTGTIANYNLDGSPTAGGVAYGTGPALAVSAAGTVGQVLTSAGAGTPTWATAAAGTVTSVTGTAPVVSSGGTTPAISMPAATTSVNGYLTSTDWNTFNNKQPAGSYLVNGGALGTPSSGTVTNLTGTASISINGTVGATTANTGAFTTLSATGQITFGERAFLNSTGRISVAGATTIYSIINTGSSVGSSATLVLVNGYLVATPTNSFIDLVLFMPNGTPAVISAINRGSPAARTYTSSGISLQLAMASGTYNVANSNIEQAC